MAVSVNDRYIRAVASASQTVFTYDFPIALTSDIEILKIDATTAVVTTLVYATDYTLTGVGADAGGTFVLTSGATINDIYVAYGVTPYARATDFTGATQVTTDAINTDYNEEEKQIQQIERDLGRAILIPLSDDVSAFDSALPSAADRASKYIKFAADGLSVTADSGTTAVAGAGGSDTQVQYNTLGNLGGISGWTTNGTTTLTGVGQFNIDNLRLDGNTISSTNTNGDVVITPDGTGNLDLSGSTEAMKMPVGTTAQRPAAPEAGFVRFNTTTSTLETYDGSTWITQSGGSGDVTGPGSSTDNAIVRFNGTGGTLIQNSGVSITDTGIIEGISIELIEIKDISSNSVITIGGATTPVNYLDITNADTGVGPTISALGSDLNVDINITPKGSGNIVLDATSWPNADGTADQVVATSGAGVGSWKTIDGYRLMSQQIFTASGTWTKPAGIEAISVTVSGGGGGGAGAVASANPGGGGAGAGTAIKWITSGLGATETITIGAGGTAGTAGVAGGAGGTSSFGAHCSATGGGGGPTGGGTPASGGVGSSGDINLAGAYGQNTVPAGTWSGADGGDSFWGGSTTGSSGSASAGATGYGSGGAGGGVAGATAYAGGAGKSGIIVVDEYIKALS